MATATCEASTAGKKTRISLFSDERRVMNDESFTFAPSIYRFALAESWSFLSCTASAGAKCKPLCIDHSSLITSFPHHRHDNRSVAGADVAFQVNDLLPGSQDRLGVAHR